MIRPTDPVSAETTAAATRRRSPFRLLGALISVTATSLAGLVLLIYPWMDGWEKNRLSVWVPGWTSGYLRGAVSGLGAVSLSLTLASVVRVRRKPR